MIYSFGILLRNIKDTTQSQSIRFNSTASNYLEAWQEATNKAIEELKEKPTTWYIEIIRSFPA